MVSLFLFTYIYFIYFLQNVYYQSKFFKVLKKFLIGELYFWVIIKWDCNYKIGFNIKEYLVQKNEHSFYWVPGPVLQAGDRDELDTSSALQESKGRTLWWGSLALSLAGFKSPFVSPFGIIPHINQIYRGWWTNSDNVLICAENYHSHMGQNSSLSMTSTFFSLWGELHRESNYD